ncbi:hypothetical protein I5677_03410 [Mobilitalea sibirica]|uniref:CARDB domain-containing protein n=1 Tax=Mobilitalea sibirica TaxID=1462919 RepID=A0A8J7KW49_9FIRM|nr:hypothetical protein [Mobilitalea sibirica]MBH1939942.1 hypothetical protein [Mobilitalea sibirica]
MDREYLDKLKKIRDDKLRLFYKDEMNRKMMKCGDLNEEPYNPTTFLYIRAFLGDNGNRPIPSGKCYCLSPDIELYLNGSVFDTVNPLLPESNYTVQVTVTNDGDQACNSCTVDLYLCKPSLGFSTQGGTMIGITNTRIEAHSSATVEFPFTTTKDMEGHRCMFARAYSLTSNDYPEDMVNFNSYTDRHIGQQNLNIVHQGKTLEFDVNRIIKEKGKNVYIVFKRDNVLFENQLISKRFALSNKRVFTDKIKLYEKNNLMTKPEIITKRSKVLNLLKSSNQKNKLKLSNENQYNIKLPYIPGTKELEQGKWSYQIRSELSNIKMEIPMLGLEKNEAIPMRLAVIDPATGESMGEITVIVVA